MSTLRNVAIPLMLFAFCRVAYPCIDFPPGLEPTLLGEIVPIFTKNQNTDEIQGTAKTVINIDGSGKVTKVTIIDIQPKGIDRDPVIKAILKAKFNIPELNRIVNIEDYIYTFDFDIRALNNELNMDAR